MGGGYFDFFSYTRKLGPFLWFQYSGFFQENEYFWGYENLGDIFTESSQNWTGFRGHFYAF